MNHTNINKKRHDERKSTKEFNTKLKTKKFSKRDLQLITETKQR